MYYTEPSCADDFASWRGAYMVCTPHAELHPYAPKTIQKLGNTARWDNNTESHIVVAPFIGKFIVGPLL